MILLTICTDAIDRYHSVMNDLNKKFGKMDKTEAKVRFVSIFEKQKLDFIQEGTYQRRKRWFNLKYYTWVEQQGKTIEELNAQKSQEYWLAQQEKIYQTDKLLIEARKDYLKSILV